MKVCLLYSEKDWDNTGHYYDEKAIIQDLGLKTLFLAAAKEIEYEDGKVKSVRDADRFIEETMKKVMMVPLETEGEILYRQEVVKDCLDNEELICGLYDTTTEILAKWDKLGRKAKGNTKTRDTVGNLITEIHVLQLFVNGLSEIKKICAGASARLRSAGFRAFWERLCAAYPDQMEADLKRILKDISFFANEKEHEEAVGSRMVQKPRIVMGCGIGDGLKPDLFRLQDIATELRKNRSPNSTIGRAQEYISSLITDSFSVKKEMAVQTQAAQMEYQVVRYIVSCCAPFLNAFWHFFDQLCFQIAFYRGAITLEHYMQRFHIRSCYPKVGAREHMCFRELREFVMSIEQRIEPVGNTCDIADKMLLIVTGANQGGKSTFLRSVGIAQVMLQCGLKVAAESYESGIFTSLFTHFTRREDSEMNSGRLDEELSRMSQIVDHLDAASMVLLNESFASTTEKEGSVIAYDIVRALVEAGVKVLTVTHLLSFARRMYEEASVEVASDAELSESRSSSEELPMGKASSAGLPAKGHWGVEFLSAERMENGRRTYRMIQHAPELTSFGLDLYDEMIGV